MDTNTKIIYRTLRGNNYGWYVKDRDEENICVAIYVNKVRLIAIVNKKDIIKI